MTPMQPSELGMPHRLILALLGAKKGETIPRKLWLQKELFYLARDKPRMKEGLQFVPYLQGPWSEPSDLALDDLRSLGLVSFDPKYGNHVELTSAGRAFYKELANQMPVELREEVEEVKDLMNDLSENELLLFVYETYPRMTTGSVVKEKALLDRVSYAQRLYKKGKVSLERAAELAAVPLRDFRRLVGA